MLARLRHFFLRVGDTFWVVPAGVVLMAGLLAVLCVQVDRTGALPPILLEGAWLYSGGATGARTLLGAVAASAIGVAGTVFSITIAALSLAAGQMGPRLLRNFVRDRGNQFTLGILLGTFTYALVVLRSVRATEEGEFTPHLAMTVGIVLALVCVAMLIYFVGHIASRINVDTVIGLVGDDLQRSLREVRPPEADAAPVPEPDWVGAACIASPHAGYLQQFDQSGLFAWAVKHNAQVRVLVRPGDFVFPGSVVAQIQPAVDGAQRAILNALALGSARTSSADLEYSIRQLVEVAMRALSPGINDPFTAVSVIDRLGSALCELAKIRLPTGRFSKCGRLVLAAPVVDYEGLCDAMLHPLRQTSGGNVLVLVRLLEMLSAVVGCELDETRRQALRRHAGLVVADGRRSIPNASDLADLHRRYEEFCTRANEDGFCQKSA